jgi:uncharacterized protein (TIGR02217 family)
MFDDVRLNEAVERGAKFIMGFKTSILLMFSGREKRNVVWAQQRKRFDIAYGISTREDYEESVAFFAARQGKGRGFRFKDWSDYQIAAGQIIGTGDAVTRDYQIIKSYTSSVSYNRTITRPVASSIIVKVAGVVSTQWTLQTGGIIRFNTNPPGSPPVYYIPQVGQVVTIACDFDVPVRFDTDEISVELEWSEAGSIDSMPIIEVRE